MKILPTLPVTDQSTVPPLRSSLDSPFIQLFHSLTLSDFAQFFFLRRENFYMFVHSLFISIQIVLRDKDKVVASYCLRKQD